LQKEHLLLTLESRGMSPPAKTLSALVIVSAMSINTGLGNAFPSFPGSAWECSPEAPPPCLKSPQPVNIITYVTVFHTGKAEPCVRRSQAEPGSEKGRCEHEDGRMAETMIKATLSNSARKGATTASYHLSWTAKKPAVSYLAKGKPGLFFHPCLSL